LRSSEEFEAAQEQVMTALRAHFKPEFLNRVDDIVIFNPLTEEQLKHIIELRLQDLRRILAERKITIDLTPAAQELLFVVGYDRAYGARPLKRAIQRLIQDPLALKLLDGEVKNGDHVIVDGDIGKQQMIFKVSSPLETPREPEMAAD
jgi:ATP-dependent Clp protease ATP-binding subunit ClpB